MKMDEYLSSVRDIETRIQAVERAGETKQPEYPVPSPSVPSDFGEHARLMMDLMVLAFQADLTRVSTTLFSIEIKPARLRRRDRASGRPPRPETKSTSGQRSKSAHAPP